MPSHAYYADGSAEKMDLDKLNEGLNEMEDLGNWANEMEKTGKTYDELAAMKK